MPLAKAQIAALAEQLVAAERDRKPIAPLTEQHPDMDAADAYAVQQDWIERRLAAGSRLVGWKVGLTSVAMQRMLNVDSPDFGHLLDSMAIEDGGTIDTSALIWPRVEPEIAFLLKADLRGPGMTPEAVLRATEAVMPALEVIDSRIRDWKIKLPDTIADNASCGRFVIGRQRVSPESIDLGLVGMNYYLDDQLVSTATGAAVLGHPAAAVAWLCNTLAGFGQGLEAGQFIMPGSLVGAVDAKPGGRFKAVFDRLGSIAIDVK